MNQLTKRDKRVQPTTHSFTPKLVEFTSFASISACRIQSAHFAVCKLLKDEPNL
jgi:hypothetical protein